MRYTRLGGSTQTADPAARVVDGKIETFIYYGVSLNEDTNADGIADIEIIPDSRINYDIYEVRGVYDLNARNIEQNQFFFIFY